MAKYRCLREYWIHDHFVQPGEVIDLPDGAKPGKFMEPYVEQAAAAPSTEAVEKSKPRGVRASDRSVVD